MVAPVFFTPKKSPSGSPLLFCTQDGYQIQVNPFIWPTTRGKLVCGIFESCPVGKYTSKDRWRYLVQLKTTQRNNFPLYNLTVSVWCQRPFPVSSGTRRHSQKQTKPSQNLRSNSGERSSYERGGCGVLGVAEKISSWKKVETLRKFTLYPALLHCCKVTRYPPSVDASCAQSGTVADVRRPEAFQAAE